MWPYPNINESSTMKDRAILVKLMTIRRYNTYPLSQAGTIRSTFPNPFQQFLVVNIDFLKTSILKGFKRCECKKQAGEMNIFSEIQ